MLACKSADTFVDPLEKLKSTTFPALSRKELAQTICEHLHWHTPSGGNRSRPRWACWSSSSRPAS